MIAEYSYMPFTSEEIKKFFRLLIFRSLSPLLQITQKFKPQSVDPINGNDLIFHIFGKNAEKHMRKFKRYFTVVDPTVIPPPKKEYPN